MIEFLKMLHVRWPLYSNLGLKCIGSIPCTSCGIIRRRKHNFCSYKMVGIWSWETLWVADIACTISLSRRQHFQSPKALSSDYEAGTTKPNYQFTDSLIVVNFFYMLLYSLQECCFLLIFNNRIGDLFCPLCNLVLTHRK